MVSFRLSSLALLALSVVTVFAQDSVKSPQGDDIPLTSPKLAVKVSTSFPQSEIFGVKLVNGHTTQALLSFQNAEPNPVAVAFVGGSLWGPDAATQGATETIIRNFTSTRYNVQIPAGESESLSYNFATDLHPQDLRLQIVAVVTNTEGTVYTLGAFNETVSVVEPNASLFDPQLIFLYLLLAAGFAASCYFIYSTWITTLFPQKAGQKAGGDRKRAAATPKKAAQGDSAAAASGLNGTTGTSTGASSFDASWIPEGHMQRPESRRLKSGGGAGRPKSRPV